MTKRNIAHSKKVLAMILGLLLLTISCAKAPVRTTPIGVSAEEEARLAAARAAQERMEEEKIKKGEKGELTVSKLYEDKEELKALETFQNQDIHFAFDSYVLSSKAQKILDNKVTWLRNHPAIKIIIEGHCDERGSNEYNLALGERRANSAREYLVNAGISKDRLHTISYGEEKPLALGSDEASWAINRRAHFVVWHR